MQGTATPPKKRTPDRIPFVEGMRGVAALYVVLSHVCSMSDPSRLAGRQSHVKAEWFQSVTLFFSYGHLAVASFIVISGFCLQISLFKGGDGRIKSIPRFFVKRARRILPAYYGSLAVSVCVAAFITPHFHGKPFEQYVPVTRENVLAHVFLVQNWSIDWMYKLNGVLWSIAIEAQLYILFPLLVLSVVRIGRWWTGVLSAAAAFCVLHYAPETIKLYPWFLPLFVLGMISAHLAVKPHPVWGPAAWVGRVAGLACLGTCIYGARNNWTDPATDTLIAGFVACLCYAGSISRPTPTVRLLSIRPLLSLGAFSYSLYLVHNPIQQVLYYVRPSFVTGEVATFWYLVAMLPVIILAAWIFSLFLEKPFISKPKKVRRPEGAWVPTRLPLQGTVSAGSAVAEPEAARQREPGRRSTVAGWSSLS